MNPGGLLDPDEATAYLQQWKSRIDRMAADTQAMSTRLDALRVRAEDPNGLVEVTIDATGALVDVRFSGRIHQFAPDVVGRAVMSAVGEARRKAAEQSKEIVTETMGPDSVAGRTITERLERQLGGDHG